MTTTGTAQTLGWRTMVVHGTAMVIVLAIVLRAVPDPQPTDEYNMQRIRADAGSPAAMT